MSSMKKWTCILYNWAYTSGVEARRSLVDTFVRFNCLRKQSRVPTFLHIISACTFHFRSFDIITPSYLVDETFSIEATFK